MSIYDGDQGLATVVVNGTHVPATAAVVKAAAPASSAYTFTANYTHTVRGVHFNFRKGSTVSLSADVKALLLAAGAPMTAA